MGSRHQSLSWAQSITPAHSQQSGSAGSVAGHHSIHSHATEDGEVSSSESDSSQDEGDDAEEEDKAKEDKGRIEISSDEQEASDGEDWQEHPHIQDTLTSVSQVFGEHEDTNHESDPREKVFSRSLSSEEGPPTDEALHDRTRQKCSCWTHALMLGIVRKLPMVSQAGQHRTQ